MTQVLKMLIRTANAQCHRIKFKHTFTRKGIKSKSVEFREPCFFISSFALDNKSCVASEKQMLVTPRNDVQPVIYMRCRIVFLDFFLVSHFSQTQNKLEMKRHDGLRPLRSKQVCKLSICRYICTKCCDANEKNFSWQISNFWYDFFLTEMKAEQIKNIEYDDAWAQAPWRSHKHTLFSCRFFKFSNRHWDEVRERFGRHGGQFMKSKYQNDTYSSEFGFNFLHQLSY